MYRGSLCMSPFFIKRAFSIVSSWDVAYCVSSFMLAEDLFAKFKFSRTWDIAFRNTLKKGYALADLFKKLACKIIFRSVAIKWI